MNQRRLRVALWLILASGVSASYGQTPPNMKTPAKPPAVPAAPAAVAKPAVATMPAPAPTAAAMTAPAPAVATAKPPATPSAPVAPALPAAVPQLTIANLPPLPPPSAQVPPGASLQQNPVNMFAQPAPPPANLPKITVIDPNAALPQTTLAVPRTAPSN